jgi:hypothetical protein
MSAVDRQAARSAILKAVREMAAKHPGADYRVAREASGLLGTIKAICKRNWPTARQCWEAVGLDRSHLVDEFYFTQLDLKKSGR